MNKAGYIGLFFGLFLNFNFKTAAQNNRTLREKDSCTVLMENFTYDMKDSLTYNIEKRPMPGLIKYIKNCSSNYKYPADYQDKTFIIQVPSYLKRRYFTFGDNSFWINFYDTTSADNSTIRSVNIYYDFDSSYKRFVFEEVSKGKRLVLIDSTSGRKVYPFTNYNGDYAGNIFMDNNIVVLYYTKEKEFEEELRKSILSFKLK